MLTEAAAHRWFRVATKTVRSETDLQASPSDTSKVVPNRFEDHEAVDLSTGSHPEDNPLPGDDATATAQGVSESHEDRECGEPSPIPTLNSWCCSSAKVVPSRNEDREAGDIHVCRHSHLVLCFALYVDDAKASTQGGSESLRRP